MYTSGSAQDDAAAVSSRSLARSHSNGAPALGALQWFCRRFGHQSILQLRPPACDCEHQNMSRSLQASGTLKRLWWLRCIIAIPSD
jgi:hypothetical protein